MCPGSRMLPPSVARATVIHHGMAALFLSHSSSDDPLARALQARLREDEIDLFVDYEPPGGAVSAIEAIRAPSGEARALVCLVTDAWLDSADCFNYFVAAWTEGIRIIPLIAVSGDARSDDADARLTRLRSEASGVELSPLLNDKQSFDFDQAPEALDALLNRLRHTGEEGELLPEAFAIDQDGHPVPFPGLDAFSDDDAHAAVFFGRGSETARLLRALRATRARPDERALVILGTSGAGKSSLLRAGVLPRLRRESTAWLPMRVFRPGNEPLSSFAAALARSLTDHGVTESATALHAALSSAWSDAPRDDQGLTAAGREQLASRIEAEAHRLREATGSPGATWLISIDQAEQLVRSPGEDGDALADYLMAATTPEVNGRLLLTTRADRVAEIQRHPRFEGIPLRGHDLRSMPHKRLSLIVEGPARRYGVAVAPGLVSAVQESAPEQDALPPIAYALRRLWRKDAPSHTLTVDSFREVGTIDAAAERALFEPGASPTESSTASDARIDALGASTFVPRLVDISEAGEPVCLTADWSSFDAAARKMLERFVEADLAIKAQDAVAVRHEALATEWLRLQSWLEAERERRQAFSALRTAAWAWSNTAQDEDVAHCGPRLREAERLRDEGRFSDQWTPVERAYLAACRDAEKRPVPPPPKRQTRWRAVLVAGVLAAVAGYLGFTDPDTRRWLQSAWPSDLSPDVGAAAGVVRLTPEQKAFADQRVRPYVLTVNDELALEPGQAFRECKTDCPEMVVVPAGAFEMGDQLAEWPFARPVRAVTIGAAFAVSRTEVTFDDWEVCVQHGPCSPVDDGGFGRGRKPVINVSWEEAHLYTEWLSSVTERTYRLPTEAEWEYSARGGNPAAYAWGPNIVPGRANCRDCGHRLAGAGPLEVGSFEANAFGLYDMHGNVWEWVEDCWHHGFTDGPTDGAAWMADATADCGQAPVRGGAWDLSFNLTRSAARDRRARDDRSPSVGFRLARPILR